MIIYQKFEKKVIKKLSNWVLMKSIEHQIKSTKKMSISSLKIISRPVLNATVESLTEENGSNVENVRKGFMQSAWYCSKCQKVWYCSMCQKKKKLDRELETEKQ